MAIYHCDRFRFVADMNMDGAFTITDVVLWTKEALLLPAKVVVSMLDASPRLVSFFEIDCSTGGSWGGAIFSFFAWLMLLTVTAVMSDSL